MLGPLTLGEQFRPAIPMRFREDDVGEELFLSLSGLLS